MNPLEVIGLIIKQLRIFLPFHFCDFSRNVIRENIQPFEMFWILLC